MRGPRYGCKRPRGIKSPSAFSFVRFSQKGSTALTNSLLRKSPTSSVVDGPPIFRNTTAVGPLEAASELAMFAAVA
jgi:hypothetical protein